MNILILSAGTRNKIVQYFKRELEGIGKIIATDNSALAPALYEAHKHYIVPKITDPNYIDTILSICRQEKINGVISLIDPELEILARNESIFLENGVVPIISDYKSVILAYSKYEMNLELTKHNIPTIKTYNSLESFYNDFNKKNISFPVFVKPNKGSASKGIGIVETAEELENKFKNERDLIIQEYMNGDEYGADVYIDLIDNKPKTIFLKKKLVMRAGETEKSVSVINKEINKIIFKMLESIPFKGVIDIDIFEHNGKYYISEINPRFGGGYLHAFELGINIPRMIIKNLNGILNNTNSIYREGTYMMKYNEVLIKELSYDE